MQEIQQFLTQQYMIYTPILMLLFIWSFIWKGIALWKAAQNQSKIWFVVLLIVNTVGILEIIYIFCCSKKKTEQPQV